MYKQLHKITIVRVYTLYSYFIFTKWQENEKQILIKNKYIVKIKEQNKVYDKCENIYNKHGQTSVFKHVNKQIQNNNPDYKEVSFEQCPACETESPILNGTCLVCGSPIDMKVLREVEVIIISDGGIVEEIILLKGKNNTKEAVKRIREQMEAWDKHFLFHEDFPINPSDINNHLYEELESSGKEIKWDCNGIIECP